MVKDANLCGEWPTIKTIKGYQILKLAGAYQRGKWKCWESVMLMDYYYGNIIIWLCCSFFRSEALGFPFPSIKCTPLQKPDMTFMSSDSLCSLVIFSLLFIDICWGPVWGTPPVAKVMRKEARHMQRQDRASGVPLEILKHLPPKPEPAYFTTLCSHLHLWLYGGLSPTTSFREGVNLELQLIIIPGHDRSVSTYKLLWRFSSLVRPHVIVHSLPTVRCTRCSKLSKYRFFWAVRRLLV